MALDQHLRKCKVKEDIIKRIMNVDYPKTEKKPKQDQANFLAAAMEACDEFLDYETVSDVMYDRACCKTGARLKNSKNFAKEHGDKSLEEQLQLLGQVKFMGKPFLNQDGCIETIAVGSKDSSNMTCPCWHLGKMTPSNGPMPLSYCKCCGGHFMFHYQKSLGLKLRLKEVVSSIINSEGSSPCVFVYEILPK